ncbi:hypothetical protein HPB50_015304 [Hyalomma asiaticum]|uniref:Uncharacterized protein n=1 Tax=Hyalomma asiaticum TaxID=266040 RepID=A0ACB7TIM5_HYAAI|nr:hypothetical protein HPB50_015304 [Hyalomma asiaticum]
MTTRSELQFPTPALRLSVRCPLNASTTHPLASAVSKLWEHLRLMEWLDPELVAAVMSLVTSSDQGLSEVLDRMQGVWNFHIQGLFKSLLHLTEPTAFFVCLDMSLKRSIASLDDHSIDNQEAVNVIREICTRVKAVPDLTAVAFESSAVPEKVQRSLCIGNVSSKNWLQNNSIIYALIHEAQLLVKAILDAQEEVCCPDSLSRLADLAHKLASEVGSVCSHIKTSVNRTRLLVDVEKARNDIEFTARQMQLFLDLGKDKPVANMSVAPFAQNFLLLASEILKALPILCGQAPAPARP